MWVQHGLGHDREWYSGVTVTGLMTGAAQLQLACTLGSGIQPSHAKSATVAHVTNTPLSGTKFVEGSNISLGLSTH
jgi:hypothetical protein